MVVAVVAVLFRAQYCPSNFSFVAKKPISFKYKRRVRGAREFWGGGILEGSVK